MEFRQSATRQYAHFLFYPTLLNEEAAISQCEIVMEEVIQRLQDKQFQYFIGGHVTNCLKQCGFKDAECVTKTTGDKSLQTALGRSGRVGRCSLISNELVGVHDTECRWDCQQPLACFGIRWSSSREHNISNKLDARVCSDADEGHVHKGDFW